MIHNKSDWKEKQFSGKRQANRTEEVGFVGGQSPTKEISFLTMLHSNFCPINWDGSVVDYRGSNG